MREAGIKRAFHCISRRMTYEACSLTHPHGEAVQQLVRHANQLNVHSVGPCEPHVPPQAVAHREGLVERPHVVPAPEHNPHDLPWRLLLRVRGKDNDPVGRAVTHVHDLVHLYRGDLILDKSPKESSRAFSGQTGRHTVNFNSLSSYSP